MHRHSRAWHRHRRRTKRRKRNRSAAPDAVRATPLDDPPLSHSLATCLAAHRCLPSLLCQLALLLHFVCVCLSCQFCFDPLILSGCLAGIRIRIRSCSCYCFCSHCHCMQFARHRQPDKERQRERGSYVIAMSSSSSYSHSHSHCLTVCLSVSPSFHAPSSLSFSGFVYKHLMDH